MTLEEMQSLCKVAKVTTQDEVWAVSPIYCLLDFDKADFCKLIDAIGLEKWVAAAERWKRLSAAEEMLSAKERYIREKARLAQLSSECEGLAEFVARYEAENRL